MSQSFNTSQGTLLRIAAFKKLSRAHAPPENEGHSLAAARGHVPRLRISVATRPARPDVRATPRRALRRSLLAPDGAARPGAAPSERRAAQFRDPRAAHRLRAERR